MTIYRKVLCSERLPEYCMTRIFIDKYGNSNQLSIDRKDEVYDRKYRRFITERDLLIKYTYWLEEIELGDLKFTKEDATPEFVDGINYILNKLK